MTIIDGYMIVQEPQKNRIVISLPQTWQTVQGTTGGVAERRLEISGKEEAIILCLVKGLFENG